MTSINFYKRDTVINRIKDNLNQINQDYFEGNHGILYVTDNDDYVTVENQCAYIADYDPQKLFDALENFSKEDFGFLFPYDLWDYLDHCKYAPENQESGNQLKTDDELSFAEKRQVALVDMLLSEPVPTTEFSGLDDWTISLIPDSQNINTEASTLNELVEELEKKNRELTKLVEELKWETLELTQSIEEMHDVRRRENKEGSEIVNRLMTRVHDLECAVYLLQQENKQLKNQSEAKPEPKPTAKKRPKFKLPENFTDYQQECELLINALSCFYDIKKGKWNGNILQFVLTPTDAEKAKHPYPDKWKAGLYLQPGQWTVDKVNQSDPDDWENWFMDINDFADANEIEIS